MKIRDIRQTASCGSLHDAKLFISLVPGRLTVIV